MITKKIAIVAVFLFGLTTSTFCLGQKIILLTKENGVYTIPCSINGVKRSLVFDTGASNVTISLELAELLYRSGKLSDSHIKGYGRSQTASGHIVDNMNIIIDNIEISGIHLKNVDAIVIKGQNVPLLLGLSAIQKLGKVTLLENKLIVESNLLEDSQLTEVRAKISFFINKEKYDEAISLLKQIEKQNALEEIDVFNMSLCYCNIRDNNKALMYCQLWIGLYLGTNSSNASDICCLTGIAYMGLKRHHEADYWFAKAINIANDSNAIYYKIEYTNKLSIYNKYKALNYIKAKAYDRSIEAFNNAIQYRMEYLGIMEEDLIKGKVKDELIGIWLYSISELYSVFIQNNKLSKHYAILAALCGNQNAIDFCNYYKIDYNFLH